MKSDEEIDAERKVLERSIGPTRAEWYAEACRIEVPPCDLPADVRAAGHVELLWACRYREMAVAAHRLADGLLRIAARAEDWSAVDVRAAVAGLLVMTPDELAKAIGEGRAS